MIIFERLGGWGLGNSLFQIATTVAIAEFNNTGYGFPDDCYFRKLRFENNVSHFKRQLPWVVFSEIVKEGYDFWGTSDVGFRQFPKANRTLVIDGFFQSEKYFKTSRENVLRVFEIKDQYQEYIQNKYKYLIEDDCCVLHVRRNDYATARELIILDMEYYKKAVDHFGNAVHYIIFSDDIAWCKENFTFLSNKTFIEEGVDILEMHLMTYFKKHIIANSTFSWWGAWMAKNSTVVMPNPSNNWFSEIYYQETKNTSTYLDLVCENWLTL